MNANPHMHCPFCVKTESFHDPVILKAHYRVKHVDKGIEFAGIFNRFLETDKFSYGELPM